MKKNLTIIIFVLTIILSACASKKAALSSDVARDGSSFEKAIVINETNGHAGVSAEYSWIKEHHPGYRTTMQSLVFKEKKPFDVLETQNQNGDKKTFYFDISKFFRKF